MFLKSFEKPFYWASVPIRHGPSDRVIFRVADRVAERSTLEGSWVSGGHPRSAGFFRNPLAMLAFMQRSIFL
jgi:hypothetical protein